MRLLLGNLPSLLTAKYQCLAQYWFCMYFRKTSWYWVEYDDSSWGLISVALSHFLNDRNFRKWFRICADMRSMPIDGVNSAWYLDSICCGNYTTKNKSCFLGVVFLAKARMTPSVWWNISLYTVIMWCTETGCLFDIQRVQYGNGLNTSMTYFRMVHSLWDVKSGLILLYVGFVSHSHVNSPNQKARSRMSNIEFQQVLTPIIGSTAI